MRKRKILTLIATFILALSFSVTLFAAVISDSIRETHNVSLSSDVMKVSLNGTDYSESVAVSNDTTIYVDKYSEGYDLIAVSADQSDGFVIASNKNEASVNVTDMPFKSGTSYYAVAVMHHTYNRYVSTLLDFELLNNEYRHAVINDDLNIGNITDLYDSQGNYIGNKESYDLKDGVYDYYGVLIKNLIDIKTVSNDGPITYKLEEISTSTIVNMKNMRRKGIYDSNLNPLTGTVKLADKTTIYPNAFYDRYGRKLNQFYCLEPITDASSNVVSYKENNYVFTKDSSKNDILIINGIELDQSQMDVNDEITINLKNCYYENSIIIDNAYSSKVYKNIYLLNNIDLKEDVTLLMPCNINLLNNNITLSSNLDIKHYYHGNFIFSNMTIAAKTGNFVDTSGNVITNASTKKVSVICPNGTISKPNDMYINEVTGKDNLLSDAIDFAKGYFNNDSVYYENDIYSLTYYNPILPKKFYDEDVTISYTYTDESEFVVERKTTNEAKEVVITATSGKTSLSSSVNVWIVGTSNQAKVDSIAKATEYILAEGFKNTTESKMYLNYDTIKGIVGSNVISYEAMSGIEVSDIYLPVVAPAKYNQSYTLYTRSGSGTDLDPYVYTKVVKDDGQALSNLETYYEKYLVFERASYTFSDHAYGHLNAVLTDGTDYTQTIDVPLAAISKTKYNALLTDEIGQIFFSDDTPYVLKKPEDLVKYDVKTIKYTPMVKNGTKYEVTDVLPIIDYEMSNMGMLNDMDYYVYVEVELNDGSPTAFYTNKILATASSGGGAGRNDYQSSLFEKEFNDMSIFIGLSDDFALSNNLYYYLEIVDSTSEYNTYLTLYRKVVPATIDEAKGIITSKEDRVYYYLDESTLALTVINSASDVVDLKPMYTLPSESDNITNYRMVFLTTSDNIPKTSNEITVTAYISDSSSMQTGTAIKDARGDGKINLHDGLFDYHKNPIYELTNGKEKYIITYDSSKVVTSVTYINSLGEESSIPSTQKVDISGFYCNGYVYNNIAQGAKLYIKNGIFSTETLSEATKLSSYTYKNLSFALTYYDYGTEEYNNYGFVKTDVVADFTDNTNFYKKDKTLITDNNYNLSNGLYDQTGKPLKNVMVSDSSFTFNYDENDNCTGYVVNYTIANNLSGYKDRISSQQTTFYDIEKHIKTIYVQNYSFTIPGVYRPIDFNAELNGNNAVAVDMTGEELASSKPGVFDMYKALMDIYGQSNGSSEAKGFKEMNGYKYFLLVSDLDNAEVIANYDSTGAITKDANGNYENLDCSITVDNNKNNRSVNLVTVMSLLPKLKYIYISNANFATNVDIRTVTYNGKNMVTNIVELSLDNIKDKDSTSTGFQSNLQFTNYLNLEKLIITNSLMDNRSGNFAIYRKLRYLDLSNNLFTDINFITTGVELIYIDISNNQISSFEPLRKLTKLNKLYVTGNNISTSLTLGSNTIYPYGTPRLDGATLYGETNIPTLIYVSERNTLTDTDYETFLYETLYEGNNNYLYAVYTANAISYLDKYYDGLELDLSLFDKAGYVTMVYISNDGLTYSALDSSASPQYLDENDNPLASGYFKTKNKTYVHAIIGVTNNGYTIYREIYFANA